MATVRSGTETAVTPTRCTGTVIPEHVFLSHSRDRSGAQPMHPGVGDRRLNGGVATRWKIQVETKVNEKGISQCLKRH